MFGGDGSGRSFEKSGRVLLIEITRPDEKKDEDGKGKGRGRVGKSRGMLKKKGYRELANKRTNERTTEDKNSSVGIN